MSSHHIVRENQEPALLVASLSALDREYLGQLLEWSPTIFADDYTIDFLQADGIKVDFVVSNRVLSNLDLQEQTQVLPLLHDFITDGLNYLNQKQYKAVNILCDTVPVAITDFCGDINIVLFMSGRRYVLVQEQYEKWKRAGDLIFVRENQLKSLVGIRKEAEDTFVVEKDGFIYLAFNTPDFVLIGEDI